MLIGLHGKAGCGKSTVASHLATHHCFLEYSFAHPLKAASCELLNLDYEFFEDQDLKNIKLDYWGFSPREFLQKLGTEGIRNLFGADFWIKRLQYDLAFYDTKETDIVVTDCRFQNEVDYIKNSGGIILHLTRAGADGNIGIQNHASEADLDFSSYSPEQYVRLSNNGTIHTLQESLDFLVKHCF